MIQNSWFLRCFVSVHYTCTCTSTQNRHRFVVFILKEGDPASEFLNEPLTPGGCINNNLPSVKTIRVSWLFHSPIYFYFRFKIKCNIFPIFKIYFHFIWFPITIYKLSQGVAKYSVVNNKYKFPIKMSIPVIHGVFLQLIALKTIIIIITIYYCIFSSQFYQLQF